MQKVAIIGGVTSSAFAQGVEFNVGPRGVYVDERSHDWRRDREYRRNNDVVTPGTRL